MISLFRSFISLFRSFVSRLGRGFLFSTKLFGISSGEFQIIVNVKALRVRPYRYVVMLGAHIPQLLSWAAPSRVLIMRQPCG